MSERTLPPYPKWILIVLLFLTPFIGLFDLVFGGASLAALAGGDLAATTGTITRSVVVEETDAAGDVTYRADIRYRYRADGREYEGEGIEWGGGSISSSLELLAQEDVDAYPVGREVTVYYERNDPGDASLRADLGGFMVVPLMLLTPFNVALLVLWLSAINIQRRRSWLAAQWERPDPEVAPPGTELLADGPRVRLRAVNIGPLLAGLIGAGVTGFLCTFGGVALVIFVEPPAAVVAGGYALLLAVGAGLPWALRRRSLESGRLDLVVDRSARALAPNGGDPGGADARDFDDISRVEVEKKVTHSRTSDGKSSTKTDYLVHLVGAKGERDTLFTFGNEPTKAECVAHWLRTVTGVRDV